MKSRLIFEPDSNFEILLLTAHCPLPTAHCPLHSQRRHEVRVNLNDHSRAERRDRQ